MQDVTTELKLTWWPSLQDYNEAIQTPRISIQDPELKTGLPYEDALGLPRPVTGAFASVYRMHCENKDYALRLFLRNIQDQSKRYALISDFVQHDDLPYTVTFDFLSNGIKSRGDWFPALKMEWIDGTPFEEYIVEHLTDSTKIGALADNFVAMMKDLRRAGIAHGDLQHGNIIMCGDEIRLVDYDGMYVPAMWSFLATELGHPNYQHPLRGEHHFGPYLDNFSAWIIYASLKALQVDPRLMNQLGGGDDCLLFRKTDFLAPLNSAAFAALEQHESEELQKLGRFVRAQLKITPDHIPYLTPGLTDSCDVVLEDIPDFVSSVKAGPRLVRNVPSDWLDKENLGALSSDLPEKSFESKPAASTPSWIVEAKTSTPSVWVKPGQAATAPPAATTASPVSKVVSAGHVQAQIPPELSGGIPRKVGFNSSLGRRRPQFFQWFMLVNPFVWCMVMYFFASFTTDEYIRAHEKTYFATVTNVSRYETTKEAHKYPHTIVKVAYKVDGERYSFEEDMGQDFGDWKPGQTIPIWALPMKPDEHEGIGQGPGGKQANDNIMGIFCLVANLILESHIWLRPLWHRHLARKGKPIHVRIANIYKRNVKGVSYSFANIVYSVSGIQYNREVRLTEKESQLLSIGSEEIALYDEIFPAHIVLYKFLLYKPILALSANYQSITHQNP